MYDQPRYEPHEVTGYFDDGTMNRPVVPGTVARVSPLDEPRDQTYEVSRLTPEGLGEVRVQFADELPFKLSKAVLDRGRQRYTVFCVPCHSPLGDGRGLIVQRGFSPPPSFHDPQIKAKPLGHYFDVITNGHGAMYSYKARIPTRDRWCIAAYIRALQLSQDAPLDTLPDQDKTQIDQMAKNEMKKPAAPAAEHHEGGHE
jgi:mono/diheme cytochrome c family protein